MVKDLDRKPYEEQLRSLCFSNLEKRGLSGDLITVFSFLMRGNGVAEIIPSLR